MLHLQKKSLNWTLKHALQFGDTDVFPTPFEFEAMKHDWGEVQKFLLAQDVHNWSTRPARSLLSPKSRYGFRIITQLDPLDFLIFGALVFEIGADLEAQRVPIQENVVFSYRFAPERNGKMYRSDIGYHEFQQQSKRLAAQSTSTHVVVTDIADFYPRIYSHRLENALTGSTDKTDHVTAIRKLLSGWNETESHGIPVGSAPARLLAEITISDVDEALMARGIRFIRYIDDYRLFAGSYAEAFRHLACLAQILYENHGLTLQPQKTSINKARDFERIYLSSQEDAELDELHSRFQGLFDALGVTDPYAPIDYDDLEEEQQELIDSLHLKEVFEQELVSRPDVDLGVIKFVLRRMGQLGDDSIVPLILKHFEALHAAFGDIVGYLRNLRHLKSEARQKLGQRLLDTLESSMLNDLPYYRMWAFSLFTDSTEWDNESRFQKLLNDSNDQFSRRELILALGRAKQRHWFQSQWRHLFDEPHWTRRALLAAASCLAADARKHWYRSIFPRLDPLEKAVISWAKDNPFD